MMTRAQYQRTNPVAVRRIMTPENRYFAAVTAGVMLKKHAENISGGAPLTEMRIRDGQLFDGDVLTGGLLAMHGAWKNLGGGESMPVDAVQDLFQKGLEPLGRLFAGEQGVKENGLSELMVSITEELNRRPGFYSDALKPNVAPGRSGRQAWVGR